MDLSLSQTDIYTILTALETKKDNLLIEIENIDLAMKKIANLQYVNISNNSEIKY